MKGEGNQQDYGFRVYDPRLGRFLSVDPLTKQYPHYTPYQFAGNKPIWAVDLDGLEDAWYMYIWNSGPKQTVAVADDLIQGTINSVTIFGSGVVMPVINQVHVISKEGPHPGGAYDPNNKVEWAVPYKFENWKFVRQDHLMYNNISFEDDKDIMSASVDVVLMPLAVKSPFKFGNKTIQWVADEVTDMAVKDFVVPKFLEKVFESISPAPSLQTTNNTEPEPKPTPLLSSEAQGQEQKSSTSSSQIETQPSSSQGDIPNIKFSRSTC